MLSTPKVNRFRPSLGEPSRVNRLRAQSPGASSVGSVEDVPRTNSPSSRRGASQGANSRRGTTRHSRDPRPVGDKVFAAQCAKNVVEFLTARGFSKTFSHEKLLKDPSTKEFYEVFRFLIAQLDPQLELEGKAEDEVPPLMKKLKYPVEVNRSKLQAISGPNTWPQLLAVLDWLTVLVRINEDLIEPLAACQLGLADLGDPDRDAGDHHVLRSLHENYLSFLSGKDDSGDEERLRQIYTERIDALRGEIERLEEHQVETEQRVKDFQAEHERLLELQKAPAQYEVEMDRLRGIIQAQEHKVQTLEDETGVKQAEEQELQKEIEDLQAQRAALAEQVESQAYSKRDIERLHAERNHLRHTFKDLKAESEKAEQEVWELGMQENNRSEEIGRLVRQVNDAAESLGSDLTGEQADLFDLRVRIDMLEPSDALAAISFEDQRKRAQEAAAEHSEASQKVEGDLSEVLEAQRLVHEELEDKEREISRGKARLQQLQRMCQDFREWSATQLDDAQRTAEGTEDALHQMSIANSATSIRDAAEVDKLKLALEAVKTQGAVERAQMQELIRRDEDRLEEHQKLIRRELEGYAKTTASLCDDVEAATTEADEAEALTRRASLAARGGC